MTYRFLNTIGLVFKAKLMYTYLFSNYKVNKLGIKSLIMIHVYRFFPDVDYVYAPSTFG